MLILIYEIWMLMEGRVPGDYQYKNKVVAVGSRMNKILYNSYIKKLLDPLGKGEVPGSNPGACTIWHFWPSNY